MSYNNLYETFRNNELIDNVIGELKVFVDRYSSVLDDKVIKYFKNIVEDRIPGNLISKVYINGLTMITYNTAISDYQNYYYKTSYSYLKANFHHLQMQDTPLEQ